MGNENKENEMLDEVKSENNPFASDKTEVEPDKKDENDCEDAITALKEEIDKINNQYIRLAEDKCKKEKLF